MRRKILPFILGSALAVAAVAPAAAGHHTDQLNVQRGGAAGLVAAVVQVAVNDIDIDIANRSLNNLLRNADIDVLNNVLNNSLNNNDILNDLNVEILKNVNVSGNVVTVDVISLGGDVIGTITSRP